MKIADMISESVVLDVKGARVVYNPQRTTLGDVEALEEIDPDAPDQHAWAKVIDLLCRVLVEWDLEDDAGPIPLTPEGIRRVPARIVDLVVQTIQEHSEPSSEEGEGSSVASSTPASDSSKPQQESQTGTGSSPPPDTSAYLLGNLPASLPAG